MVSRERLQVDENGLFTRDGGLPLDKGLPCSGRGGFFGLA